MNIQTDAQSLSSYDPSKPDVAFLNNHTCSEGRMSEDHAIWIIEKATAILRVEPNVLQVGALIVILVCGDTHEQYVRGRVLFVRL